MKKLTARLSKLFDIYENSKLMVWFILINAILWVWCSYILAAFGREQIAQDLSTTAVVSIIGVCLGYFTKASIEQLSKHNQWPDKPVYKDPSDTDEDEEGKI